MSKQLTNFKTTFTENYVVAFLDPSRSGWQFGFGYNSMNCNRSLDLKKCRASFVDEITLIRTSSWIASVHTNFKDLVTQPIIDVSSQMIIYAISEDDLDLIPIIRLENREAIREWVATNL